jgi:uncharacterized protein YndB with AHSA1/START domain
VTPKYFFQTAVKSDFKPGSDIRYEMKDPDGKDVAPVWGKILESVPKHRLVYTFSGTAGPTAESRVTYEIEPAGEAMKLTVVHDRFGDNDKLFESTSNGWPVVLSGLKTLLETGKPLGIDKM